MLPEILLNIAIEPINSANSAVIAPREEFNLSESMSDITAKDAASHNMSSNYETKFDAEQGTSLVLTIDKTIQHYLEKGLSQAVIDNDAVSAYGIVMEVDTGAILAMATMPDYNLNEPSVITDKEKKIISMLYQPIIGHTATALYFTFLDDLDNFFPSLAKIVP